jgi:hypothetical protein
MYQLTVAYYLWTLGYHSAMLLAQVVGKEICGRFAAG